MNHRIITLVGMPGAGKSYCVDYLMSRGLPSVYMGGITIDEVKRRGLEVNEVNERSVREELRQVEGAGVMAVRSLEKIMQHFEDGQPIVVADGLYSWTEYKIFKDAYADDAIIIAITAPRSLRHERLAHRAIRPLDKNAVVAREYAEIENMEKGGPIANADYTIVNDSSPEVMLESLIAILNAEGINLD